MGPVPRDVNFKRSLYIASYGAKTCHLQCLLAGLPEAPGLHAHKLRAARLALGVEQAVVLRYVAVAHGEERHYLQVQRLASCAASGRKPHGNATSGGDHGVYVIPDVRKCLEQVVVCTLDIVPSPGSAEVRRAQTSVIRVQRRHGGSIMAIEGIEH